MAEADTVLVPDTSPSAATETEQRLTLRPAARRTSRDRRLAVAVGSLALLGATASVAVGSQVALPGDTLYPMKRAIEDVRTDLAVGDARTGQLMMSQATERLEETEGLTRRDDVDVRATEDTLRDFTEQAEGAAVLMTAAYTDSGRPETIVALRDFTGDSMDRLEALEPTVPPAAHDELVAAADAVVAIDDDATATCPSCGGAGVVNVPISLTSSGLLPTTPPEPGDRDATARAGPAARTAAGPRRRRCRCPRSPARSRRRCPPLPGADRFAGAHPGCRRATATRTAAVHHRRPAAAAAADVDHHAAAAVAAADHAARRRCRPSRALLPPLPSLSGLVPARLAVAPQTTSRHRPPAPCPDGAQPKTESRSISSV